MKTWLIAHRGARSDARENTKAAFEAAHNYPVGWVELDVHKTIDNIVVVHHDADVQGTSIKHTTFSDLKNIDPGLTTFDEAIIAINGLPIILEVKSKSTVPLITTHIQSNPHWIVASFHASELHDLAELGVDKERMFLLQKKQPVQHLRRASAAKFGGVGVNKYYLSPIFYWRSRRKGFRIYTYTVNSLWLARTFRIFYPDVAICTDRPDLLQKLS